MKNIGTFGQYSVTEDYISKRFFVKIWENGKEKSIPVSMHKRIINLKHSTGTVVEFSAYNHRGEIRYKDSRTPKKSLLSPIDCIAELVRMLDITKDYAANLMKL